MSDILPLIALSALFSITVIAVQCYGHGGTAQARDLKHLLELSLARRELQGSKTASEDDATISSDLRENFISDI